MKAITLQHNATAVTLEYAQRDGRWYQVAIDGNGKRFDAQRVMSWELANKLNDHIACGWQPVD